MTTTIATAGPLMLPGQEAAVPGPVSMDLMYVMHHGFRRDLAAFAAAARLTPVEDRDTWRALADRWAVFAKILHHHHTGEDTGVWPYLLERTDAAGREVLEAMEAEHAEIDPLLEASAAGFAVLATRADEDTRSALAVRLVAARESLGRHLRHEETEAVPLIQALIAPDEWERIDEEFFKTGLGLADFASIVPWALHGLTAEQRRRVFAGTGTPFRFLWLVVRRGFERRERAAFRHVPTA